jgi:hypothetical protein
MEPATTTTNSNVNNGTEFSLASMLWLLDTPIEQQMPPDTNVNEEKTTLAPPTSPSDGSGNLMVIIINLFNLDNSFLLLLFRSLTTEENLLAIIKTRRMIHQFWTLNSNYPIGMQKWRRKKKRRKKQLLTEKNAVKSPIMLNHNKKSIYFFISKQKKNVYFIGTSARCIF